MKIATKSGIVDVNKRSDYGKFLQGYVSTGAGDGAGTMRKMWDLAIAIKANNCGWFQQGVPLGNMYNGNHIQLNPTQDNYNKD